MSMGMGVRNIGCIGKMNESTLMGKMDRFKISRILTKSNPFPYLYGFLQIHRQ